MSVIRILSTSNYHIIISIITKSCREIRMNKLIYGLVFITLTYTITANAEAENQTYPLEYFALRDVISQVNISPEGGRLALMKIPSKEGNPILEVFQSSDLSQKPFRVNADPMEIVGYSWISEDDILLNLRQQVRDKIDGFNRGVYEGKLAKFNLKTKKITEFREVNARVVNLLPEEPNKVILAFNAKSGGSKEARLRFRPSHYYEFDLRKGTKKLLIQGSIALANIGFDGKGNPRIGFGFDDKSRDSVYYYRKANSDDWQEIYRLSENSFESFNIGGLDDIKPDTLIVTAHNGKDKAGLWEFNTHTKSFGDLIYQRNDVDVSGVRRHSNTWEKADKITAVRYLLDKDHYEYFDAEEAALYKQLDISIPFAHSIRISSRAKGNKGMVVYNVGPQDPGSYYLVQNNTVKKIGSKQPSFNHESLAEVEYIKYPARDGKVIPAFLTKPKGVGPFPTIVMPHGGPFVGETVGYDEWGQMLANQGYLVIQPQYRGSRGYGLDFYKSAFINGGEGGKAMQDDKDDGVKYLIDKKLADPDRVAMFGWSYGGYAALIAASRQPQMYQCVIAGAAVVDNQLQVNYYRDRLRGASKVEQEGMWVEGISPINEVAKVNVPILLIHGSVDQRVPAEHAKRYLKALDKHNKPYKYVELAGADHFSNTLFYNHQIMLYQSMVDYLKNDCGPSGI